MAQSIIGHSFNKLNIAQTSDESTISGASIPKGYVNATQIAQAGGKKLNDYLRLKRSNAYLQAFSRSTGIPVDGLVIIIDTGANDLRGTWAHPDIGISVASWCSAEFEVWANRTLRLVLQGEYKALTADAEEAKRQLEDLWEYIRRNGIEERNTWTDAIHAYMQRHCVSDNYRQWVYINVSNRLNMAITGHKADYWCKQLGCDRSSLRDHWSQKHLSRIDKIETFAAKLVEKRNTEPNEAISEAIEFYDFGVCLDVFKR